MTLIPRPDPINSSRTLTGDRRTKAIPAACCRLPPAEKLIWGVVSRTLRAPARFDRDVIRPLGGVFGGPDFVSEVANGLQLGAWTWNWCSRGQNLFDRSHPEFNPAPNRSELERGVFLQARWSR